MCWSCNPYCGGCKPPKPKPIKCPHCHVYTFPEKKFCKQCGVALPDLPAPQPVFCRYLGETCANPCNRHKKAPEEGIAAECKWHTPLKSD